MRTPRGYFHDRSLSAAALHCRQNYSRNRVAAARPRILGALLDAVLPPGRTGANSGAASAVPLGLDQQRMSSIEVQFAALTNLYQRSSGTTVWGPACA